MSQTALSGGRSKRRHAAAKLFESGAEAISNPSSKGYLPWWGLANLAILFSQLLLPPNQHSNKFFGVSYISMVIWLLVAMPSARIPLRLPVPIGFLIGLQVWTFICAIAAQFSVAQVLAVSLLTGFYLLYVLVFLQAGRALLAFPRIAKVRGLHFPRDHLHIHIRCVLAVLQVRAGDRTEPALQPHADRQLGQPGRATGVWPLWAELHHQAIACLTGATLVTGALLTRSLKRWEIGLILFLLGGAMIAQSRILYFSVAVFLGIFAVLYYRREKHRSLWLLFAIGIGIVAFIIIFRDQFAYLLSTVSLKKDETLVFRQERAWVQAIRIFDILPWTGIGPTGFLATGTGGAQFLSKFTTGANLDNGYLLILSFSGLPGLVLWLGFLISTFGASLRQALWEPAASPEQKTLAIAVFMNITGISLTMFMGNVIPNAPPNFAVCMLGGLALATHAEQVAGANRPFARVLGPRPAST